MYVTTCKVVPLVEDTLPKVGELSVEQDLEVHNGVIADHRLKVEQVVEAAPSSMYPTSQE